MKRVFVCSPYRADTPEGVAANVERARIYCRLVSDAGHRPFAPHLFYTQFLDDNDPVQRAHGIKMGVRDLCSCDEVWAFGMPTDGMTKELNMAAVAMIPIRRIAVDDAPLN